MTPQLRFPEFTDTWQVNILGDIGSTYPGLSGKSGSDFGQGSPFVTYTQIFKNTTIDHNFGRVKIKPSEKQNVVENGDIFFTGSSESPQETGYVSVILKSVENLYLNSFCFGYRTDKNKLVPAFAQYVFHSPNSRNAIVRLAQGSTRYNISKKAVMDIGLPLPSKSEQEKIAEFLMAVDERIRLQEQKLVKLEQYKRGVMQQIFSQKIRFKDENGNTYPDWEEKKLGEIARVYQPLTISQSDLTKTGYPVYGANGIIGKYDRFNHENEQIAVTCRGNTCGVINYTQPKSWITGNAMVINTDDSSKADKKFMYYQLLSQNLNYLITGSGQPQITGDIKQHKIFVPFIKEQQKIANFLTALDDKITAEKSKLTAAKQFKKALLQRMFV